MKVLFVATLDDYGDPTRGPSFEDANLHAALRNLGHDVVAFDFCERIREVGYDRMNRELFETVEREQPHVLFCVLFEEQLDRAVMRRISERTDTVTFNWFCDDHWRFDIFSKYWAPCFNWVSTAERDALPKYERIGYRNVVLTQFACNEVQYKPVTTELRYDVSFVGQPNPVRRRLIGRLQKAGISVHTRGHGWPDGRISQEQMVETFSASRINLNFCTPPRWGLKKLRIWEPLPMQIKARVFEVTACGGFLLTEPAAYLETYLRPGREIETFSTADELVDKIQYYLDHEDERAVIARRGMERTRGEHTYRHRIQKIFEQLGLPQP